MKQRAFLFSLFVLALFLLASCGTSPSPTSAAPTVTSIAALATTAAPTETMPPTRTATATATYTPTSTPTQTFTPALTKMPTASATATPDATDTLAIKTATREIKPTPTFDLKTDEGRRAFVDKLADEYKRLRNPSVDTTEEQVKRDKQTLLELLEILSASPMIDQEFIDMVPDNTPKKYLEASVLDIFTTHLHRAPPSYIINLHGGSPKLTDPGPHYKIDINLKWIAMFGENKPVPLTDEEWKIVSAAWLAKETYLMEGKTFDAIHDTTSHAAFFSVLKAYASEHPRLQEVIDMYRPETYLTNYRLWVRP